MALHFPRRPCNPTRAIFGHSTFWRELGDWGTVVPYDSKASDRGGRLSSRTPISNLTGAVLGWQVRRGFLFPIWSTSNPQHDAILAVLLTPCNIKA